MPRILTLFFIVTISFLTFSCNSNDPGPEGQNDDALPARFIEDDRTIIDRENKVYTGTGSSSSSDENESIDED